MSAPVQVLLVEDDDVEIMAMERILRSTQIPYKLTVARDGLEALAHLRGEGGGRKPMNKPCVIFLDLNLPRMNGLEFLHELRRDPEHAATEVIVLTTSNASNDRRDAYGYHVKGYIVKSDYVGDSKAFAARIDGYMKDYLALSNS